MAIARCRIKTYAAGTTDPAPRALAGLVLRTYVALWALTLGCALCVLPFGPIVRAVFHFRLGLTTPGSLRLATSVYVNNLREALIPPLFGVLRLHRQSWLRRIADVTVGAAFAVNIGLASAALAAYGPRLFLYLPQWPFEWAGLALGLTVWRLARAGRREPCTFALLILSAAFCLALAAFLETYAVPQT